MLSPQVFVYNADNLLVMYGQLPYNIKVVFERGGAYYGNNRNAQGEAAGGKGQC